MPSKLGNTLSLLANVRKWVGLLFTLVILHNMTQVKVKEICLTEWNLHLRKVILLTQKCYCEVAIIIAIN